MPTDTHPPARPKRSRRRSAFDAGALYAGFLLLLLAAFAR